jgi:fermentation-respiration switch protein FrsA (DUF1100 family)
MAVRRDHPVTVRESFLLAEAWTDAIGGVSHSEILISNPEHHDPAWLEELAADGWTLTKYVREGLTNPSEPTTLSEVSHSTRGEHFDS